ncbi:MAG TPA: S8 family serine peptidase, partial [bacterium]|nr:S8 family serine peptidase [bacterium]
STCYAGIAPEAELVVQNIADLNGNITGLPDDLNVLFAQAYGGGARIHNDSWGEIGTNGYTSYSEDVDEFIWDNPEFSVVFSAGNSGIDADASGVVDGSSINAPANAKNCIAVGAGENDRDESSTPEPAYNAAYGWFWPWDYPAAPISDDHVSNHPEGLAAFSSRGPTLDGRFKPEIVAPGTNVVSCRSHAIDLSQSVLWGPGGLSGSLSEYYTFSGGTSMAAPLVTGAAALVRERYRTAFGAVPSAALIKATLLNGARDTTPGQYGTGAAREVPPAPRPNNVEGWGRLDLPSSAPLQDEGDFYYFQATPGLSTGGEDSYRISVSPMLAALSVTLAWSDYPGSAPAGGALVNDLDLTVAGPGGQVYYPNRATAAEGLVYDDGTVEDEQTGFLGVVEAVRFTPSRYPARLDEGVFYLGSTAGSYPAETGIRVYRGDASGPKELLWSGNRTVTAPGWQSVDFSGEGIAVASGDIFLGVAPLDDDLFWAADVDLETAGRTWQYVPGSGWVKIPILDALIRARTTATSVQDRTNNVETVDIDLPAPGVYTLRVRGYNVPCGPQPYALVAARPAWTAENAPERFVIASGDYDGDGTADPAVFRWSDGLWSARGLTRFYFGRMGDYPASGDYDGDGTTDAAVFRPATGMWSARSLTRFWLGDDESVPVPGDYDADGTADGAVFGSADGLWRIRGQSAFYYGRSGDVPVPARYEAGVSAPTRAAVYRPSSGLWALRGLTGYHYGGAEDIPLPGDYDVFPGADLAVFNPDTGRWAMYAFTRFYLGKEGDEPVPADYAGTGVDKFGVFRPGSGRWVVRGLTAFYYGDSRSIPVTR